FAEETASNGTAISSGSESEDMPRWLDLLATSQLDLMSDEWVELEMMAYAEGPYWLTFLVRGIEFLMILLSSLTFQGFGFRVLGMFLLGMALHRSGFFRGRGGPAPIVLVVIGLGPALLAESLIGASAVSAGATFDLTWLAIET